MNDTHILTLLRHRQEELQRREKRHLRYLAWRERYPRPVQQTESRWRRLSRLAALFLS